MCDRIYNSVFQFFYVRKVVTVFNKCMHDLLISLVKVSTFVQILHARSINEWMEINAVYAAYGAKSYVITFISELISFFISIILVCEMKF